MKTKTMVTRYHLSSSPKASSFSPPSSRDSSVLRYGAWGAFAVLLGSACYLNSLGGDFVHDDIFAIKENRDLLSNTSIWSLFSNDFWGEAMSSVTSHKSYRPLTVLTFRLNYLFHGLEPWGYHVVNLLLHLLATLLFGCFCQWEVFGGCGEALQLSGLAMLLFTSHPIHTEAVSGVVGRADVLACIMFLLSLQLYCSCARTTKGGWMIFKLSLSMLSASAGMLCKEHAATVLGVCLVYELLVASRKNLRDFIKGDTSLSDHTNMLIRVGVILGTTCSLLVVRIGLLHGHLPHFSEQDNPASFSPSLLTRILTYSYLIYFNLRLLVHPYTLCYDWQMGSIPLVHSLTDPRNLITLASFLSLVALSCSTLWGRGRMSHASLLGLLLLGVPFLPASNLFIRVGFVVAERILYIPSMGYILLVVTGIQCLYQRCSFRLLLVGPVILLLLLFSARTIDRNVVWATRESLFRSAMATVPNNSKVHFNYANFLKDSGRVQEAIHFYRNAIRSSPNHAVSHNNLGSLLSGKEAEFHFQQAVQHNPLHYKAFYNLGKNLQQQGRLEEAEAAFRESLRIRPTYLDSVMGLASLLAEEGKEEEGAVLMDQAVKMAPLDPNVHNNRGVHLMRLGKAEEAVKSYQEAIRLSPDHLTALTGLARAYRSLGQDQKAEEAYRKSLAVKEDVSTYLYLGSMLHNTHQYYKAQQAFRQGLAIDQDRVDLICGLGQSLLEGKRTKEVRDLLEEAIPKHPQASCLQQKMGVLLTQQGQLAQAVSHLSEAAELSSDKEERASSLHMKGGLLKDLGRLEEAEQTYRAVLAISPDMAATRMNLGAILHLKKEFSSARVEYRAALRLDPNNSVIKDNLRKLERAAAATSTKT